MAPKVEDIAENKRKKGCCYDTRADQRHHRVLRVLRLLMPWTWRAYFYIDILLNRVETALLATMR